MRSYTESPQEEEYITGVMRRLPDRLAYGLVKVAEPPPEQEIQPAPSADEISELIDQFVQRVSLEEVAENLTTHQEYQQRLIRRGLLKIVDENKEDQVNPDLVDRVAKTLKKQRKKKKVRRTVADVLDPLDLPMMIVAALKVIAAKCCTGRSAQDKRLWSNAQFLKNSKTAADVAKFLFDIGVAHGVNLNAGRLTQLARDPNAYAGFCNICGVSMADHDDHGACKGADNVHDENIAQGVPGAAEVIDE